VVFSNRGHKDRGGGGAGVAVGSSRAADNGPRPSGVSGAIVVRTGEGSGHGRRERRGERD
jgi:hypothetical protein